ncbi:GAF domain-containing protein [Sphingomonas sp. PsM26]|nr:GAF domain-containing protein [Sphingomonas sp. PsM26]
MAEQLFSPATGAIADRIRAYQWDAHPLGEPSTWPAALKVTLATMLNSPEAMFIAWGPDLFAFFNDAYGDILGDRVDTAIGRPFAELWADVWDDIAPIVDKALAGEPSRFADRPLTMVRGGELEETWWSFSYSPLRDETGSIVGMLCVTSETTERFLGDQRQEFRSRLDEALRSLDDPRAIKGVANAMLGEHLQADGVGYADALDDRCERTLIEQDWTAPGLPSVAGFHVLEDYGVETRASLKTGRVVRIDDVAVHPDTGPETGNAFGRINTRAYVNIPLLKDGRFVALQYVLSTKPRRWTDHEVTLAGEVAERTWAAVERARAEASMREDRRSLATLNSAAASLAGELNLDNLVQTVTDAGVALTGAQFGSFFSNSLDAQGDLYMLYTLSGVDPSEFDKFPMPRNTAVFAPTFGGEGVVRSGDILKDKRYGNNTPNRGMPHGHLPVRSYLAAPVISRSGDVIGGLFFGHPETDRFDAQHEASIVAIAAQAAIAIDNSRLFAAAQRDLDERRAAEARLQELNETLEHRIAQAMIERREVEEALRQSQKLEAIGQLTGGVAHDFNNLLTIIQSSADLLKRSDLTEDRRQRYIGAISETTQRAAKITGQLLAFARRQALRPETFEVSQSVALLGEILRTLAGSGIEVVIRAPDDAAYIHADPSQFDTAIVNMAVNARDAMDGAGTLTITVATTTRIPAEAGTPAISGKFVEISVADTGDGIAASDIARIFEPFFTTKDVGKGTGLGLSQVFGFTKQSGGEVRVSSTPGAGSIFTLYLPQADGSKVDDAPKIEHVSLAEGHGSSVLVVEDNEDVGAFASITLQELGYRTTWAVNADEALALLAEQPNDFDIVFSDVVMPGMNGIDLGREIKRLYPRMPVVLASGYSDVLAENGGHEFELLHKPYSVEQLARILSLAVAA